jgi:metal-responsive CopG/Arc/MetJ family transcriptional regulator
MIEVHTVKTAVSVDNQLMIEADRAAREAGISRSRLFSLALEDYLRKRKHYHIVEQLNRVYGSEPDAAEKRTAARLKTKFRRTVKERW